MRTKVLEVVGVIIVALVVLVAGGIYWADATEDRCWQSEAAQVFEHYQTIKYRSAILREAVSTGLDISNSESNSLELIYKEPNGCSLGGNGRTVVRFYFDSSDKILTAQVFRDYLASDYKMEMINERRF